MLSPKDGKKHSRWGAASKNKSKKPWAQHFFFSHRPSPLLRGRRLSGSWRGSILSRFSVGFWTLADRKLTKNRPKVDLLQGVRSECGVYEGRWSVAEIKVSTLGSLSPCGNRCRFSESAICSSRVRPPSEIKSNFKFKALRWRLTLSERSPSNSQKC